MSDNIITNLVRGTCENHVTYSSPDNTETLEELPAYSILSHHTSENLMPFIGQRFVSQEEAYEFYCSFAKQSGFSIRRHRTRGKDGVGKGITRRDFTCHRSGYPQTKQSEEDGSKLHRNRKSSRCGCLAYMRIVKKSDLNVPEWRVTCFSNVHNHELLKINEFPISCNITCEEKSRICMFAKAGLSVKNMMRLLELEKGVKLGCLPFTENDLRTFLQSFGNVNKGNDPIELVKMCKEKKDYDPFFKYDFEIDGNNRLQQISWSYGSSIKSYEAFGDAVVFDTSRRLNSYDMILGVWIGVDNHGMKCFFGCVLLRDENLQSFSWALKTFLTFMNGKSPGTILTDQNMWLKEAIANEMARTKHAFSIWHITSRFSDWFLGVLGSKYESWKIEFYRLYNLHSSHEFEEGWREMVNTYELHSNKHIISLYALRTFWALPFLKTHFFAGMTSTFNSDSIDTYFQLFLNAQDNLIIQVGNYIDSIGQEGPKKKVNLKTGSPIESHAATLLTSYAFNKLQEELVWAPQYASMMIDESLFLVRHHSEMDGGFKVVWAPQEDDFISCTCHYFEFSGILCRHVLRVLSSNNCFSIPERYLPMRWREAIVDKGNEIDDYTSPMLHEIEDSDGLAQSFHESQSLDFTEFNDGRPRDDLDFYHKRSPYFGNEIDDCSIMEDMSVNGDGDGDVFL